MQSEAPKKKIFSLQWHLTAKCTKSCRHCYLLSNPSYQIFSFPELSDNQCNQVLENFIKFLQQKERQGMIVFTGGEVFFRKDIFFRLIEKAQEEGIEWSVLGNPDLLTPRIMDEL